MKLSIIVPIYNVEAYLCRCIDSILNQTFTEFELILVDDGSPDNCGEICDQYASQDKRIKVIHKKNGGLSDARNAGLDIAQGSYIGFVDGDDTVDPKMYERLLNALESNRADIAVTGFRNLDHEGNLVAMYPNLEQEKVYSKKDYIHNFFPTVKWEIMASACNKLYCKNLFEKIRYPVGKLYEDSFVQLPLLDICKKIVVIPTHDYNYYFARENSIMNAAFSEKKFQQIELAYTQYMFFVEKDIKEQQDYALENYVTFYMIVHMSHKEIKPTFLMYSRQFRSLFIKIMRDQKICKMKKLTVCMMYINNKIALRMAQRFFPECLPDFLRA